MKRFKQTNAKAFDTWLKRREPVSKISVLELKKLLVLISENPYPVGFRYRLAGQMWQSNFMRVIDVTDHGVLLKDDLQGKRILVSDLKWILQFELDGSLHAFAPNFHYEVIPD